ncbi:MAG TPA: M48 family metallopeptidase [Mycobacteriales bacterium]|jgi:predicted metal-dependent hydrolase
MDGGGEHAGARGGVEVRRSRRRRRTVAAYQDGDRVVVLIPARFTEAEEAEWVQKMVARLEARERRSRRGDAALATRARELSRRYLGGSVTASSVRWVGNQGSRWGSCTPSDGTIRLSDRLQGMPPWVIDYVLLHELAHLAVPGHGPRFWKLLEAYPRTERARGYLEGVAATAGLDLSDTADDGDTAGTPADETATGDRPTGKTLTAETDPDPGTTP